MQTAKELAVGAVFFAALVFLGIYTVIIGNIDLKEERVRITVLFDTVGGLKEGNKVRIAGFEVGEVDDLALAPDGHSVTAKLKLNANVAMYTNAKIEVKSLSALGGKYVRLDVGSPKDGGQPVEDIRQFTFLGTAEPEVTEALTAMVQENRASLRDVFSAVEKITEGLAEGRGTLGRLLQDDTLALRAEALLERATEAMTQLEKSLRAIAEGQGTVGKLVHDETAYVELTRALRGLANIMERIDSGEGTVGRLVHDPSLYDRYASLGARLDHLAQRLEDGQGTAGKLLTDDQLYNEVLRVVTEGREALEDLREQAPISTFVGSILSAF